jgi:hypothetical protein
MEKWLTIARRRRGRVIFLLPHIIAGTNGFNKSKLRVRAAQSTRPPPQAYH